MPLHARIPTRPPSPHARTPSSGPAAARLWWRYAFLAVRKQRRRLGEAHVGWGQLRAACLLRRAYVPAYARLLAAGGALGGDAAIAGLDAQLPEPTILLFRWGGLAGGAACWRMAWGGGVCARAQNSLIGGSGAGRAVWLRGVCGVYGFALGAVFAA